MSRSSALAVAVLALWLVPASARALTTLTVEPSAPTASIGEAVQVSIFADFTAPIVGFGIDFSVDASIMMLDGPASIGPDWVAVFAPDGDGLAGLTPGAGISGDDVLLATLTLQAIGPGVAALVVSITLDDLTEGFALDPTGFDPTSIVNGFLVVVPEPASAALLGLGLAVLAVCRRGDA